MKIGKKVLAVALGVQLIVQTFPMGLGFGAETQTVNSTVGNASTTW